MGLSVQFLNTCHFLFVSKAIVAAIQYYDEIILEGRWPEQYQKVTVTEIRQIFVSKSVWHAQYIPCFQDISRHEEMVEYHREKQIPASVDFRVDQ
jgi:hypothetical protein